MITYSDNHGHLVAKLEPDDLKQLGIGRNCALIFFHTDGALDDYPDWLEQYPSKVDTILQIAEFAIQTNFKRTIECCKFSSTTHH